ncbi:MAG: site-specific integrase [Acidobacteria bacterium]|nr:site-specific integrase [Acidobacteriota bacterium]
MAAADADWSAVATSKQESSRNPRAPPFTARILGGGGTSASPKQSWFFSSGRVALKPTRSVELRREQARIGRFPPHVLRRTFATRALDQGVDVVSVADLMGRSSLDTTR